MQKTASYAAKTHRQPALQKTSERASAALTSGKLTMYFIDLDVPKDSEDKSGDSMLVVSPDGKTMLIDCGHPDAGKDVVRLLRSLGIDKIDIVVISHPHIDHLGAFPLIARTFPIARVWNTIRAIRAHSMRPLKRTIFRRRISKRETLFYSETRYGSIYSAPRMKSFIRKIIRQTRHSLSTIARFR